MMKHGAPYCRYCKYACPVPEIISERMRDYSVLDQIFFEMIQSLEDQR